MSLLKKPRVFETSYGRYSATEIIGEGGAGRVFKATDDRGDVVAIKLLDGAKATPERRRRFKNELTFGERNTHPNVITVRDRGLDGTGTKSAPFYVMPFYAESLRKLVEEGISRDHVLPLFSQCLDGVEAAHLQDVTHRDLKPENILFDPSGKRLIVADFGIAEFTEEELYTAVETAASTRLANFMYAAPEQRVRGGQCSKQTDIFALGLILNEMFTGSVPHGTGYTTIASKAPQLAYLDDLVAQMMHQLPRNRPASIDAIKKELVGRQNAFVERQRLDQLKKKVIRASEIDDPIESNPVRIDDADWADGRLMITLDPIPNEAWIQLLKFGSYSRSSVMGAGPERFSFSGNVASVPVRSQDAQHVVDHFKSWLQPVHALYVTELRRITSEQERLEREALERQIKTREERESIRGKLRF